MDQVRERELFDLIKACTQPVLGICLGCDSGTTQRREQWRRLAGHHRRRRAENDRLWSATATYGLEPRLSAGRQPPVSDEDGAYFYFVHSYAMPVNPWTIAQCNYGEPFTAAVQKDNFYGVQFHPERSGAAGAKLLKNFLEM
ncbi:glutamine amidotransferase-related protein [Shigella flexneri]